jgi:hypothetical protein
MPQQKFYVSHYHLSMLTAGHQSCKRGLSRNAYCQSKQFLTVEALSDELDSLE